MTLTEDFADRRGAAVITGGSGGLGAEVCRLLAQRGANIAITYHSRREAADEVVSFARQAGREAAAWQVALEDPAAAAGFAAAVLERFGAVHTLVHAAGPYVNQIHISRVTPDQYLRHLVGEAAGFFNIVQPLLPSLREERGSIVAVTTMATRRFLLRDGLSVSPKGAVEGLVRGLAAEEGKFGVRANSVGPGVMADGMANQLLATGEVDERDMEATRFRIPLRRFGGAVDIAEAVCFLASPRAGYITGQSLDVDGGYTI